MHFQKFQKQCEIFFFLKSFLKNSLKLNFIPFWLTYYTCTMITLIFRKSQQPQIDTNNVKFDDLLFLTQLDKNSLEI